MKEGPVEEMDKSDGEFQAHEKTHQIRAFHRWQVNNFVKAFQLLSVSNEVREFSSDCYIEIVGPVEIDSKIETLNKKPALIPCRPGFLKLLSILLPVASQVRGKK